MCAEDVFEYRKCSLVLRSQEQHRSQSSDTAVVTEMLWKCRNLVLLVHLAHNITCLSSSLSRYSSFAPSLTIFVFLQGLLREFVTLEHRLGNYFVYL